MSSTAIPDIQPDSPAGPLYGSVHVPDFGVQAFVRNEPALRQRPVAVLDGVFPLLTVAATNGRARNMGVREGMTRLQLGQFPDLHIRCRSREQEEATHQALVDCARYFTPRVEDTSGDTITLDLNGLSGLWGTPRAIAQKLLRAADKLGLEVHVATAPNPDAAICAARSRSGITLLHPGDAARKMASLPIEVLDFSDTIRETFKRWGIQTFGDLTRLPAIQISERLGQDGVRLRQLALGKVERPLRPAPEHLHFAEFMELEDAISTLEPLTFILSRLLNQLCRRLTARNLSTHQIRLTLGLTPGPKTDRTRDKTFERQIELPVPIRDSRTLLKLLQLDLDNHRPPAPVSHVTLAAEPVAPRRIQEDLFRPRTPEPEKLEVTLGRIRAIVGQDNIGTPALENSHRPDAFRMQNFRVLPPTSRLPPNPAPRKMHEAHARPAALRISRPPQPITVETEPGHGKPVRILFAGKTGRVLKSAGPWNCSGGWWRTDAWNREEWDVEVQTGWRRNLYRIYRDPRKDCWFIDGTYD